jgi:hypothetical protein
MKAIILAYLCTTVGGWLLVGGLIFLMACTMAELVDPKPFGAGAFWIGCTERAIATTLVIWTPNFLPAFIGGWIALKIAAGWSRYKDEKHTTGHLTALVGTALSFAVGIGAGLFANPDAIIAWNK